MENPETVQIPVRKALEIAKFLEQLTVSLDRIGSRAAEVMDGPRMLWDFTVAAEVAQRASSLRSDVWDACAAVLGEDAIVDIAESIRTFPEVGGPDVE